MPFDSILGVGRMPQITKDIPSFPAGYVVEDFAKYANLVSIPTATNITGNANNIIDPNYPSDTISYSIQPIGFGPQDLIFDLQKEISFIKCNINLDLYGILSWDGSTHQVLIQVSGDGINYNTVYTSAVYTSNTGIISATARYFKARFIKIRVTEPAALGSSVELRYYKLSLIVDPIQNI